MVEGIVIGVGATTVIYTFVFCIKAIVLNRRNEKIKKASKYYNNKFYSRR